MRALTAPDFPSLRILLARTVEAMRDADALAPLRIVAPGDRARDALRQGLAERLGGFLAIDVTSLPRWVDDVTLPGLRRRGGHVLTEAGFDRLAARVLDDLARSRDARRDPLLRVAGTPGVAAAVAGTLRDFLEGGFAPDDFDVTADAERDPFRVSLFRIYRAFHAALVEEGLWDRRRREGLAATCLPADGRPTFLFGFHDLTPLQRRLVLAADDRGPVVLFVPGPSPTSEPGEAATAPLLQWLQENGGPVGVHERDAGPRVGLVDGLFRSATLTDPGEESLELRTFPTEAAEVRAVARRIRREVERGGHGFHEILVTVPPGGPAALQFRRVFAAAGIPLDDRIGVPRHRTPEGRRALLLARAAASPPPEGPEREPVAAWRALLRARDVADVVARFRALHEAVHGLPVDDGTGALLDAIALVHRGRPLPLAEFAAALAGALASDRSRSAPDDGTSAVLLVSAAAARFVSRPLVFHTGRVEGSILRPPPPDPLLSDRARRWINDRHAHEGRFLPVREERRDEQLLLARFAFETATAWTMLSWAERGRAGSERRNPAELLLDLAGRRAGRPLEPGTGAFTHVAPGDDPIEARLYPVDTTDLDLALFLDGPRADEDDLALLLEAPRARHLPAVLRAAQTRWCGPTLTPHDGVLADERAIRRIEALLRGRSWSATALETLANCPFAFLMRLLELDQDRPQEDDYDPMERGRLFHEFLEKIHGRLLPDGALPITPETLAGALRILDELVDTEDVALARLPQRRRMPRRATLRSLRDDVAILLAREAHLPPNERGTPIRIEMAFGPDPEDPEESGPALVLASGERVALRGKIDRVDRRADGALEVVDYKTGVPRARSGRLRHAVDGKTELRLQLPVYLEAAGQTLREMPRRAYYSFATAQRDFERIEFTADDLDDARGEIARVVAHLLDRARDGWFPCTPGRACCRKDLESACGPGVVPRFRRKLADPALRAHVDLVRGTGEEGAS